MYTAPPDLTPFQGKFKRQAGLNSHFEIFCDPSERTTRLYCRAVIRKDSGEEVRNKFELTPIESEPGTQSFVANTPTQHTFPFIITFSLDDLDKPPIINHIPVWMDPYTSSRIP